MKSYQIELDRISMTIQPVKSLRAHFVKKRKCNHSNNNNDNDNKDVYNNSYDTTIEYYHTSFLSKSLFLPVVVNIRGVNVWR